MVQVSARVCWGCGKPLGVFAIAGRYWHPRCFKRQRQQEDTVLDYTRKTQHGLFRWDKPTHGSKDERILDVPGVGRYLVRRRGPRSRDFVVLLNGTSTKMYGDTLEQAQESVERAMAARGLNR